MLFQVISNKEYINASNSSDKKLYIGNKILRLCLLLDKKNEYIDHSLIRIDESAVGSIQIGNEYIIIANNTIYITAILDKWNIPYVDPQIEKLIEMDKILYKLTIDSDIIDLQKASFYLNMIIDNEKHKMIDHDQANICINNLLQILPSEEYVKMIEKNKEALKNYEIL